MVCKLFKLLTVLALTVSLNAQTTPPPEKCEFLSNCLPPNCMCFSTQTPVIGADPTPRTPQFVVVSFDDAVTVTNYPFYLQLSELFVNPNQCNMVMTFFINHLYNDYALTNELHRLGNEIAVRSVSATSDVENYWRKANYSVWESEMVDMRTMLSLYGLIPEEDIQGARAPFLEMGGDGMFQALYNNSFVYDSSWTTLAYTNWYNDSISGIQGGIFPYSLDFSSPQDVQVGTGPKETYPGFWELPILDLQDADNDPCNLLDTCDSNKTDCADPGCSDNVYNFLKTNFDYNYYGNRVPFGLYTRYSWFLEDDIQGSTTHRDGFIKFLEYANSKEDVYFITLSQLREWMQDPVDINDVEDFEPFICPTFPPQSDCVESTECTYDDVEGIGQVIMNICGRICPPNYPWLGNPSGA